MNRDTRPRNPDEHVDRLLEDSNFNEAQLKLISEWRKGSQLDAAVPTDGLDLQQFVLNLKRLLENPSDIDEGFEQWARQSLRDVELAPDFAVAEALLRRIADNPSKAIRYAEQKRDATSRQNSRNAKRSREARHDWWTKHIQDFLEGSPSASSDEVLAYLEETGDVEWDGKELRHKLNEADPIKRAGVRSRMDSARKRISGMS